MLDIKEIRYFIACVQTGSFSKAAEILYTTQSSVSKVIKAMEDETGIQLFERQAKGIRMTKEAENIYPHALAVIENMEKMQAAKDRTDVPALRLSCNPSSWFADTFVKFYEVNQKEKAYYQIYSANSREIVERVRERGDELGFVYVMKNQMAAFHYYLSRNYLEFTPLTETKTTIYPGCGFQGNIGEEGKIDFSELKLIQRFPDEFSPDNYWNISDSNGKTAEQAETVITTNSDYIMERVLQFGSLVNISGGYLSGRPVRETAKGVAFGVEDTNMLFGYLKRKDEKLSQLAEKFLGFITEALAPKTVLH